MRFDKLAFFFWSCYTVTDYFTYVKTYVTIQEESMEKFKSFLKRKDIEISAKRYGIDALGAMAQGLFASLLIGTIIATLGEQLGMEVLVNIGGYSELYGNSWLNFHFRGNEQLRNDISLSCSITNRCRVNA